jgi:hypothetical protein
LPEIRLGLALDIVVEHGVIRSSFVQDILDDRIVLLQIVPPLSDSHIDKTILVTYLTAEDRHVRQCFRARVVETREGYVTVGRGFPVIIVERISPDEVCDLRIHERHQPQTEMKVKLGDECLEIIDISAGGAHLVRATGKRAILKVDDTILLTIKNGEQQYDRDARIVRQWHSKGADGPEDLAVIFTPEKLTGK